MNQTRESEGLAVTDIDDDDLDLDVLMRRIRSDVERRREAAGASAIEPVVVASAADATSPELRLQRYEEAAAPLELKDRYRVEEFLRYHDEQFVRNAYRGILRREPDGPGLLSFLEPLRRGEVSKIDILGRIRYSPEGRAARTPVGGLATRFAARSARRVPIAGRVLGILQYIVRLPELAANLDRFERAYFERDLQLRRALDANNALVERAHAALENRSVDRQDKLLEDLSRLGAQIAAVEAAVGDARAQCARLQAELPRKAGVDSLAALDQTVATGFAELRRFAATLDGKADANALAEAAAALAAERAKLAALEDRVGSKWSQIDFAVADLRDADASLRQKIEAASRGDVRVPDAFYKELEDRFRGGRDEIVSRMEAYVPMIVAAGAGAPQRPVLDVGCGRGEWLEVLKARGLIAHGVDANAEMIAECVQRGLQVRSGRAVEYLRSLWASSLGAVTALHVVEHLPFSDVLALVDEALRVLCPGGVLIVETPNPENLQVGAHTFYVDPTHRHPIPPALLQFVIERRGFIGVEVIRLQRGATEGALGGAVAASSESVSALLHGPQDYAVVARKATSAAPG